MRRISSLEDLENLLRRTEQIKLYGAGLRLASFMELVEEQKLPFHASCILVSSAKGNPSTAFEIPIVEIAEAELCEADCILLTISDCFVEDVKRTLEDYGVVDQVYQLDYSIIDRIPYHKVYKEIEPYLKKYPHDVSNRNVPGKEEDIYVWSCWWQGEENAPELVQVCLKSQRENLPTQAKHIVVTWENVRDYIEMPDEIMEMARCGDLCMAHLADITRCCLLYRYGGIWLDATVYMTGKLPEEYFNYSLFTRTTGEGIYCTGVSWVTWFLGARKGEELFRFLMEMFFAYFRSHRKAIHYYMIDFLIAIACRSLPGVEEKFRRIPMNNLHGTELQKHLSEEYDPEAYQRYTEGGFLQKLTYKGSNYQENSIYTRLIHQEGKEK